MIAAVLGAATLCIAAIVVGVLVNRAAQAAPGRVAGAYLAAWRSGDVARAIAAGGIRTADDVTTITDASPSARPAISSFQIASTTFDGDSATVVAAVTQGTVTYGLHLALSRERGGWPWAPEWRLAPQSLPVVTLTVAAPSGATLMVDGDRVMVAQGGRYRLALPPGQHTMAIASTADYTGQRVSISSTLAAAPPAVVLGTALTAKGLALAQGAVRSWVDSCARTAEPAPAGCPFDTGSPPGYTLTAGHWAVSSYPRLAAAPWTDPAASGWRLVSTSNGSAVFTARVAGPQGDGTATTGAIPFGAVGTVSFAADSMGAPVARFTPSAGYSPAAGGTIT